MRSARSGLTEEMAACLFEVLWLATLVPELLYLNKTEQSDVKLTYIPVTGVISGYIDFVLISAVLPTTVLSESSELWCAQRQACVNIYSIQSCANQIVCKLGAIQRFLPPTCPKQCVTRPTHNNNNCNMTYTCSRGVMSTVGPTQLDVEGASQNIA